MDRTRSNLESAVARTGSSLRDISLKIDRNAAYLQQFLTRNSPQVLPVKVEPTEARVLPDENGPGYRRVEVDTTQIGQKVTYVVFCRISDIGIGCSPPALKSR